MPDLAVIHRHLRDAGVAIADDAAPRPVSGGDISAAWRVDADEGSIFLKTGPASSAEMFFAEAEGLSELAAAEAIRVPQVIAAHADQATAFVALEWLDTGTGSARSRR